MKETISENQYFFIGTIREFRKLIDERKKYLEE
jgi:hypothetical protein